MKFKKSMILLVLAIFIFGAASVCASDVNDTVISGEDTNQMVLSADNEMDADNFKACEENSTVTQEENDEIASDESVGSIEESEKEILASEDSENSVGANDNGDILGATLSYTDLFELIYSNGQETPAEITLYNNYEFGNDYDRIYHGGINVKKNLIIHGNGHTINGKGIMGHFTLAKTATLTIYDLNLINGKRIDTTGSPSMNNLGSSIIVPTNTKLNAINCNFTNCKALSGGAIFSYSGSTTITLTNCIFSSNKATSTDYDEDNGGGVIAGSPTQLTITNCVFRDNDAATDGGAIVVAGTALTIKGSTFSGNSVNSNQAVGGAIATFSCSGVTIENSKFDNNKIISTAAGGAALYFEDSGTMTIINSNFTDNNANCHGGALLVREGNKLNIIDSNFRNNTAKYCGGAIWISDINANIQNSNFIENTALSEIIGGGAIYCDETGSLTITKSHFTNNKANDANGAAIYSSGRLDATESSFTDNNALRGAAICINNLPTASLVNSNFTNNVAHYGGAIYANATLEIRGSRFDSNRVSGNSKEGGAIISFADLKITDSIFNNNKAEGSATLGGAIYTSSSLNIQNSSFTGGSASYGGAIVLHEFADVFITDSNFTNNDAYVGGAIYNKANLEITGSRFENDESRTFGGAIFTLADLKVSDSIFDNNKAIYDSGDGAAIYVGAQITTLNVINSNFTNNKADDFSGAIYAESVTNVNIRGSNFENNEARVGAATYINSCSNAYVENSNFKNNTARGSGAIYVLNSDFTINHSNVTDNNVDAGVLTIVGNKIDVNDVTFANNYADSIGGAIAVKESALTVVGSRFNNNKAKSMGGAIDAEGPMIIKTSNFTNNTSTGGGAITVNASSLNIAESNFISNSAMMGGAILAFNSLDLTIFKSIFNNNNVLTGDNSVFGGAILVTGSVLKINESEFNDNEAKQLGGVIYASSSSTLNIYNSAFNRNKAGQDGGAIYVPSALNIYNSAFNNNEASQNGGAIYSAYSTLNIANSAFNNNKADQDAGAIYTNSAFNVARSNFTSNDAGRYGGAIYSVSSPALEITGSTFDDNNAFAAGGAVFVYGSDMIMSGDVFNNNRAGYYGGAIYQYKGASKLSLSYTNFTNNYANGNGGAIYSMNATLNVDHRCIFNHNEKKGVYANNGLISNSIFMETDVEGGISESGNTHFTPSDFTFANIPDSIIGNSITLSITESHMFSGTVTVKIGTKSYQVNLQNGAGSKTVSDLGVGTYKAILDFPQTGEYFSSYSESNEFNVRYQTAFSIDSISDSLVGGNINLKVTESNGYTGTVTVKVGTATYEVALSNGIGTKVIKISAPGNYKAVIDFEETAQYTSAHAESNQFTVRYSTAFTLGHISDCVAGETITINVNESNGYTGTVTVKIGAKSYDVALSNGVGSRSVSDLGVGTYNAVIDFDKTAQYTSAHAESNEFAVRYNSTFVFESIPDALLGETISLKVTESNGYTGTVTVRIGAKSYDVSLSNGVGSSSVSDLGVGTYKAVLNFDGTAQYASAHAESNEFAVRYQTAFSIGNISDSLVGESIDLKVTESNGYTGTVTVKVGTEAYEVALSNGIGTKAIKISAPGNYKAVIDFDETSQYTSAHAESNEFVVKYNSTFVFESIPDALLGETISLKVTESNGYTGNVTVRIGAKSYDVSLSNGVGSRSVSDLGVGTYKAVIDFDKTELYTSAHAESNEFVVKYNSTFTIASIPTIIHGDPITINIAETNHLNDTVTITIGSFVDTVEIVNGVGYKTVKPDLAIGKYKVILNYGGSDKFVPGSCQSNEFLIKYSSFNDLNTFIGSAGSEVILEHDYAYDNDYDSQFVNGIPITKNVVIKGNGHIIDAGGLARIFNISNGAQVTFENVTLVNGRAEEGGAIYASSGTVLNVVNSNFNNNVATGDAGAICSQGVLNIAKSSFKNNADANGIGVKADNGEIINSTFIGNDISGSIKVSPDTTILIDPSFAISSIPNFIAGSSITISVSESHGLTGTVVVTIGRESYSIDIKNGRGSKIVKPNPAAGKYVATLTFNKAGKFNSSSATSNQFTVTAPKPVKTTPKLTAAKKTFKRKVNVKKYSVTLKTNKGKAIKSVKITLKVKGKTYSAKTNKKGVALFKIKNLKKKGKYKATVTFNGDKYYNKVTKKVKITVK